MIHSLPAPGDSNWLADSVAHNPNPPRLVLPYRFSEADVYTIPGMDDGSDSPLRRITKEYLTNFWQVAPQGIGCLFIGKAGTYKTYAACAIARRIHRSGVDTMFAQCPVLLNRIERNRFGADSAEAIHRLSTVPFLVMDDFSQIDSKTFASGVLVEIAEARFSNLRPTIWTGNIELREGVRVGTVLGSLYGPSFSRRITEASKGYAVYIRN